MNVSYSIPAYLSNFSAQDDRRTYADLKVFYVGETADGRIFDEEFADKLVASLPYTPVVAFFSDLKDDFIGHNGTQYIYGIVRHDANIRYEEDEGGVKWLVTSVMLYTDRFDNIGEVSKKIVGKQHSLEMDPNTTKYKITTEDNKRKIVFTDSSFIGLSVLGDDQKPAFTGSEFFQACDFDSARERFENFFSFLQNEDRGEQMEREHFKQLSEFVKLSYTEKMTKVSEALRAQLGENYWFYLIDIDDNRAVFVVYNWETSKEEYRAYKYAITEEENVTFQSDDRVYPVYVTMEQREKIEFTVTENVKDDETDKPEEKEEDEDEGDDDEEENLSITPPTSTASVNEELTNEAPKENMGDASETDKENKNANTPDNSITSALDSRERQELEEFRREKKVALINSYSEELNNDILEGFKAKVDEFTFTDLEVALALEYRKFARQNRATSNTNPNVPFSFTNVQVVTSSRERTFAEIIKSNVK